MVFQTEEESPTQAAQALPGNVEKLANIAEQMLNAINDSKTKLPTKVSVDVLRERGQDLRAVLANSHISNTQEVKENIANDQDRSPSRSLTR